MKLLGNQWSANVKEFENWLTTQTPLTTTLGLDYDNLRITLYIKSDS
jgi:hypothetical protein